MRIYHAVPEQKLFSLRSKRNRPVPPFQVSIVDGILDRSEPALQAKGALHLEEMVLWSGYPLEREIIITTALFPNTESSGLHLLLPKPEQLALMSHLREYSQLLFCDVHTHPGNIPLSEADRRHPVGRQNGFLTVIVPDYAERGLSLETSRIWQLGNGIWSEIRRADVAKYFRIISPDEAIKCL